MTTDDVADVALEEAGLDAHASPAGPGDAATDARSAAAAAEAPDR